MELNQTEQEPQQLLWRSNSQPESMVTVTLGRVMNTLLTARPKKLHDSISRLSPDDKMASLGSLDESLWFLYKYVRDAAEREEILDEVLVPMIEHSLKSKESKHGGQAMIILNWLFKDELLFQVLATNLANIIVRKDDRYITLGWCTLVRALLEYDTITDQHLVTGISEKYDALLKILCSCIPHLSYIVNKGSTTQDGFELPSRLSLSAADCFLSLTEALTKRPRVSSDRQKSSNFKASVTPAPCEKKEKLAHKTSEISNMEMEFLLWDHLQELISLVQRLLAWSRKSRPLHAKGLEKVLKWLKEIKGHYGGIQAEAGSKILRTGAILLSSCWKHYCMLLHLEDHKSFKHCRELLDQYLSGIQYITDNHSKEQMASKDGGVETRKFFLNCMCLLLGRFDGKKFESIVSEYRTQMSYVLLPQLQCHDEDVIEGVVCIFKRALFKPNHSPGNSLTDTRQMDSVLPLLLNLLDEQDGTARAVVKLIAEYCSISVDVHCLEEVLIRLTSGNTIQRKNSLDVISELVCIFSRSINANSHLAWQDIANKLLDRLTDEDDVIREQTSNLLPLIDPSLVLPGVVRLVYSSDGKVQSSACEACIGVLKYHNKFEVICVLLDCLSNLNQIQELPETDGCLEEGAKLDTDRIFKLIPQWAKSVQDWNSLVGSLIDKMFAEPSNVIIVRFLNCISEYLMEAIDVVLHRVLSQMRGQKEIDQSFIKLGSGTYKSDESERNYQSLFERLCPLLVIRLLPLRIFDDLNLSIMYGQLLNELTTNEYGDINTNGHECVAAFLLNRAFSTFEFQDVRKLAAELCGRIHPQVLLPIACSQLEHAAGLKDILKMKVCLFSVCASIKIRGKDSISNPAMIRIRNTLEAVLLWPSLVDDEVHKAQLGCVECLALMICAELQSPELRKDFTSVNKIAGKSVDPGNAVSRNCVLEHVVLHIVHDENKGISESNLGCGISALHGPMLLSFRLCMVNVLISACQKISYFGKKPFAQNSVPVLIHSAERVIDPDIGAACIQFLFSAVYHLKSAVLPYSSDLLKLALKFLGKESEKEKIAGVKLMTALMATEDVIPESILSEGLLEARSLFSSISLTDPSLDLRQLCNKLMSCLT